MMDNGGYPAAARHIMLPISIGEQYENESRRHEVL